MGNDIRQQFDLDAAKALVTIKKLASAYENLNSSLTKHVSAVKSSNANTEVVVKNLNKIKTAAKSTLTAIDSVYGAKAPVVKATAATRGGESGGVDPAKVSQAAASISQLRNAVQKLFAGAPIKNQQVFNQGLEEMVRAGRRGGLSLEAFKKQLGFLDKAVNGTDVRMRTAMKHIQGSIKTGLDDRPLANFVVSWQTMVRIVSTQLIVRAINLVRRVLIESFQAAIEFGRAIAEVGTIANNTFGSLEDVAQIVRQTSDEFGKGRQDVAEGLYQTLSNQVGNAAESLAVFRTANKLSIAAVGTTADAVNLLTAALNGFDISASESEVVAAKLFRTVELGRTRMSELANTMGRVGPLAHALGISLDETLASIATITVQGTKSAEALTQLRGVMQAMLKPSEEMKKVFKEMGVASAEAGIATFGFQGFLLEMTKVTGDSASEMGQLIRRVRGLLGAITLASSDSEKFIENLEKIQDTSSELLQEKFKLVFETPGEEVLRNFNELKNIFVVDLGPSIVQLTLSVVKFTKAISNATPPTKILLYTLGSVLVVSKLLKIAQSGWILASITGVKTLTLSLLTTVKTTKSLTAAIRVLTGSVAALNLALGVAIVAAGAVLYAFDKWDQGIAKHNKAIIEARIEQIKYNASLKSKTLENRTKLEEQRGKLFKKRTLQILQVAQKAYNERKDLAVEMDQIETDSAKTKFDSLTKLLEKYVAEYEKKYQQLQKAKLASEERVNTLTQDADTAKFDRSLRFLDAQKKLNAQVQRSVQLQKQAKGLVATGDPDKIKRGLELYKEAAGLVDIIQSAATDQRAPLEALAKAGKLTIEQRTQLLKARRTDNAAGRLGNNLLQNRIKSERNLQRILDKRAQEVKLRLERQKKLNAQIKSQFDIILDNASSVTKEGELLDEKTLAKQAEARARAFAEIRTLAGTSLEGLDLADQLQLTSLGIELNKALSPEAITFSEKAMESMSKQISDSFVEGVERGLSKVGVQIAKAFDPEFRPAAGFAGAQEDVGRVAERQGALLQLQKEITQSKIDEQAAVKELNALSAAAATQQSTQAVAYKANGLEVLKTLNALIKAETVSVGQIEAAEDAVETFRSSTVFGLTSTAKGFADTADKARLATVAIAKVRLERKDLLTDFEAAGGKEFLVGTTKFLQAVANKDVEKIELWSRWVNANFGANNIILNSMTQETAELNSQVKYMEELLSLEEARARVRVTSQSQVDAAVLREKATQVPTFSMGGMIKQMSYFANGSLARGTDTVPAMLTPGEFVMNAKSTRRFYSQLVAMNSGRQPAYRESGGPVTNVTVGDVNVSGGKDAAQTGRQIVGAIQREMRRGTSSF